MRYKLCSGIRDVGILAVMLATIASVHADDDLLSLTQGARKASQQLSTHIRGEVVKELDRTGPIRAIVVCKYSAPELASSISRQTGMRVTRVALRVRNPALGEADAWEQQALLDFEKRVAKGEKAEAMEFAEIVIEPAGRAFRYVKAIPMAQPCLVCHGSVANLSEAVKSQLAAEYPFDRAVDFQVGQIRGAISVKKTF
jgi:hypothetical protein